VVSGLLAAVPAAELGAAPDVALEVRMVIAAPSVRDPQQAPLAR